MATKKQTTNNGPWDRVHVLGGDPCLCRLFRQAIIEDSGATRVRRFDKTDSTSALRDALVVYSFEPVGDAVVVTNPDAKQLRVCMEAVESSAISASALLIITPGDTLDGRSSFTQKAQNAKRVSYFAPIEVGERGQLLDYLKEWEEGVGQTFEDDARAWIVKNAPVRMVPIKSQSGKRDTETYDLEWLESELDKVLAVKELEGGSITVADLTDIVRFEQDVDVWRFITAATAGDAAAALQMLKVISLNQGSQGALIMLLSQLEFLIGVKSLVLAGIRSADQIAASMALEPYIGRYLLPDWSSAADLPKPAPPNIWRIRKALERPLPSIESISANYQAVISAIRDIRASLDEGIVFTYLALALANEANYQEPFVGAF